MESSADEIAYEDPNLGIRLFKDGRVQRLIGTEFVQASVHPETGVQSKDITIDPETGVSARLYIPKITNPDEKLPLLVYFHGGGFCIETAFSPTYHNYLNSLVAEAQIVVVSVDYRRAPEHPLPIAYEDSWATVKWVNSHVAGGDGRESWLKDHADLDRVFFAGDSAGAIIAHHMGIRIGSDGFSGLKLNLVGIVMFHPSFRKKLPGKRGDYLERHWRFICPSSTGLDDPLINPGNDPKLVSLACKKLMICLAEKDLFNEMGMYYYEVLRKSGWRGAVEILEDEGVGHVYFLHYPTCEKAVALLKEVASFLNQV